jgi:hypothetical protein
VSCGVAGGGNFPLRSWLNSFFDSGLSSSRRGQTGLDSSKCSRPRYRYTRAFLDHDALDDVDCVQQRARAGWWRRGSASAGSPLSFSSWVARVYRSTRGLVPFAPTHPTYPVEREKSAKVQKSGLIGPPSSAADIRRRPIRAHAHAPARLRRPRPPNLCSTHRALPLTDCR